MVQILDTTQDQNEKVQFSNVFGQNGPYFVTTMKNQTFKTIGI